MGFLDDLRFLRNSYTISDVKRMLLRQRAVRKGGACAAPPRRSVGRQAGLLVDAMLGSFHTAPPRPTPTRVPPPSM